MCKCMYACECVSTCVCVCVCVLVCACVCMCDFPVEIKAGKGVIGNFVGMQHGSSTELSLLCLSLSGGGYWRTFWNSRPKRLHFLDYCGE